MTKERKTAAEIATIIQSYLANGADLRIAVYFDREHGWRAKVYSSDPTNQARVNVTVDELRERYTLEEWRS